jgi:hypothetical protein
MIDLEALVDDMSDLIVGHAKAANFRENQMRPIAERKLSV